MGRRDFFRKIQHKRYVSHSFQNPYFRNREKNTKTFVFLIISILLIVIFSVFSFFMFHPLFFIRNVHVSGFESITQDQIEKALRSFAEQKIFFVLDRQNRFLFNTKKLTEFLNEQFTFRYLQIDKTGSFVNIKLEERTSNLIWKTGDQIYIVDLEGVVIREAGGEEGLPIFVDLNNVETKIGGTVLTTTEISAVFRFHEHLNAQKISFSLTEFDRLAGKWTGVLVSDGYRILFDTMGDVDAQAQRLDVLRREKIQDVSKLEYIDLRFGDHIYYK